jgi:hypothetical protein
MIKEFGKPQRRADYVPPVLKMRWMRVIFGAPPYAHEKAPDHRMLPTQQASGPTIGHSGRTVLIGNGDRERVSVEFRPVQAQPYASPVRRRKRRPYHGAIAPYSSDPVTETLGRNCQLLIQ